MEHQEAVPDQVLNEIDQTLVNSKNSLKIYRNQTETVELDFTLTKHSNANEFMIRVNIPNTANLAVGQVLDIIVESKKTTLNPQSYQNRTAELYELTPKLKPLKVEIFKLGVVKSTRLVQSVSDYTTTTTTQAPSVSMGVGVLGVLSSQDPSGLILRFNQYLDLVRRLKYIGEFLGFNLENFMEEMSGRMKREEDQSDQTRLLEISAKEDQRDEVAKESMGSHNKLSSFEVSLFFEGTFMIKSVLYTTSWLFKLISIVLIQKMKKSGKVVEWWLKYIYYQRKLHFLMVMVSLADILFFSTRIVLHRRNSTMGMIVKTVCCLNITLLVVDLLEMFMITIGLKYKKEGEREIDGNFEGNKLDFIDLEERRSPRKKSDGSQEDSLSDKEDEQERRKTDLQEGDKKKERHRFSPKKMNRRKRKK